MMHDIRFFVGHTAELFEFLHLLESGLYELSNMLQSNY